MSNQKSTHDGFSAKFVRKETRKFAKKPSAMSNASTTSVTSSGGPARRTGRSGKSRGEMLKDLSVLNRSCALVDTEGTAKKEEAEGQRILRARRLQVECKKSKFVGSSPARSKFAGRVSTKGRTRKKCHQPPLFSRLSGWLVTHSHYSRFF